MICNGSLQHYLKHYLKINGNEHRTSDDDLFLTWRVHAQTMTSCAVHKVCKATSMRLRSTLAVYLLAALAVTSAQQPCAPRSTLVYPTAPRGLGKQLYYHCACRTVLLYKPEYQLGHPDNYSFSLSIKKTWIKYSNKISSNFENRSTVAVWPVIYITLTCF